MRLPRRQFKRSTFNRVLKYLKVANESIDSLSIRRDAFNNTLRLTFVINSHEGKIALSIDSMSDGTVKWLALITAILTAESIFSVEEPENYLHPWMQKEIIRIFRERISEERDESFVIMTTHSETIINSCNPDELVILSMEKGRTIAQRPKDISNLKRIINETGFGLGYFYIAGDIQDA